MPDQLGRDVLRVGGAAAVAEQQQLVPGQDRLDEKCGHRHGVVELIGELPFHVGTGEDAVAQRRRQTYAIDAQRTFDWDAHPTLQVCRPFGSRATSWTSQPAFRIASRTSCFRSNRQ